MKLKNKPKSEDRPEKIKTDIKRTISKSKRVGKSFHKNTNEFLSILENSTDVIARYDTDLNCIYCNRAVENLIGIPVEKLIGKAPHDFIEEGEQVEFIEFSLRSTLTSGEIQEVEQIFSTVDGVKYFNTRIIPEKDKKGKIKSLLAISRDITERKRVEEERLIHLKFFESMDKINRAIQGAQDLNSMMSDVLETSLSIYDCDRLFLLYPCDPEATTFRVPMEVTKPEFPGAKVLNVEIPVSVGESENMKEALNSSTPLTYTEGTERPISTAKQFGVRSQMFVSVYPKLGKPWIFGMHQCSYPRIWTQEEKRLFLEISRRLADGLTSALMLAELKLSEGNYRDLVDNALVGIYRISLGGNIIYGNEALLHILEFDENDYSSLNVINFYKNPSDRERLIEVVKEKGEIRNFETELISFKGKPINVMLSSKLSGNTLLGMIMDITERKLAEKSLQESENLNKTLVKHLPQKIFIKDNNSIYIVSNNNFANDFGISPEEIKGKNDFDFFPGDLAQAYRNDDHEVITNGVIKDIEEKYIQHGEERWIHTIKVPYKDDKNNIIGVLGVFEDITDRKRVEKALKESEARYRRLFESMTDCFVQVIMSGEIVDVNRSYLEMLGYSREEIFKLKYTDITPEKWLKFEQNIVETQILIDGSSGVYEKEYIRKDRTIFPVELRTYLLRDDEGNPSGMWAIVRDITERKRDEHERLEHLSFFENMDKINRTIQGKNNIEQVMGTVLEIMLEIFNCDRAWLVYPCDPEADFWGVPLERTKPEYPGALGLGIDIPLDPNVKKVFQIMRSTNDPVTFGQGSDYPLVGEVPERFQEQSQIAIVMYPIIDKPWLFGMHQCSYPRVWTLEEKRLLTEVSRRLGDTLTSLLMYNNLCKSEAENRAIVNAVPDLLFRINSNEIILDFRKPENIDLNISSEQFIGQTIIEVLPHNVSRSVTNAIKKALETNQVEIFEFDMIINNSQKYFESRVVAFSNKEVLIVVRDITERKLSEIKLQEITKIQKAIFATVPDIIMQVDNNKIYTWSNQAGFEFFGDDVIGKEASFYFEGEQETYYNVQPVFNGYEQVFYVESWQRRRDNKKRLLGWWCKVLKDENRNVIGAISSAQDITERNEMEEALKQSEMRFRELFDEAPVGYHEIDIDGRIIQVNKTELEMLGYTQDEMLNHHICEFIMEKEISLYSTKAKLNGNEKVGESYERNYRRKDGAIVPVLMKDRSIKNSDGTIIGIRSTIQDISERKKNEVKLHDSNIQLEHTLTELQETQKMLLHQERMRALGQMASGIAHDINNSLAPIVGYSDMLLKYEDMDEKVKKRLSLIRMAGLDIIKTIERMKEFYRPRIEQDEFKLLDLNKTILNTIDLTRHRWKTIPESEGKVIKIETNLKNNLPLIQGHESEIREALTNLVINASDALPEGGEIIIISYKSNGNTIIEIKDNGFGMDEETLNHCLDPFYTTKGDKGTGLGLSMVFGIMQRHLGKIEIESEKGKGTTIKLIFPNQGLCSYDMKKENSLLLPSLNLLCIDDDETMRDILLYMLEKINQKVKLASSGKLGLEMFFSAFEEGNPFDLVITDLGMPYMDGKSVAETIKNKFPTTPIILLTGWGAFIEKNSIRSVDYILKKPLTMDELFKALKTVLKIP